MRLGTVAAATATTVIGAGATALAVGRYASDAALRTPSGLPFPGDPRITVQAVADGWITLDRNAAALRPGTYGLTGDGCHAVVGPLAEDAPHPAGAVVRRLLRVSKGAPRPGARMRLTPQVYTGHPREALELECSDVEVPGELGPLPAWFVPGSRDLWVIIAHGLGTTREHPMIVMPFLHRYRLPVLDLAYRNDAGAPRSTDGVSHLGDSEWRDLDAAIRHAVRHGARRVVLYGWSTGASMALHAAANSALRHHIRGLILDSPILDWQATVRALAAARGTPRPLLSLAVRAAEGSTGLHSDRLAGATDPALLSVPTLLLHGPDDTIAPWGPSRELAARRPDLVTLHPFAQAQHAAMWNTAPSAYEETLRRFLTPLM
ncbi:alpha/beta hydrolase [Streptomyces sp. MST-110588]|uniref:alpha/beta hydrolase n=1 Tax=Streptomyces sp. MST-110588 TaxID=2833628 RepID=UPI001F5C3C7A|nr:alpha/beta hydrolase [Streptomyces sp. MST-110588]UNO42778.1 hypothetical protein KGS77_28660 [Streptomyces sp. MST-110588]